jgi:transcription initiation factor TFIID subunit 12
MSDNANAASSSSASAQQAGAASSNAHEGTNNVIRAIGNILKSQTGEPLSNEKISSLLLANMTTLVQQGKLTQNQIIQVDNQFFVSLEFFLISETPTYLVEGVCRYPQTHFNLHHQPQHPLQLAAIQRQVIPFIYSVFGRNSYSFRPRRQVLPTAIKSSSSDTTSTLPTLTSAAEHYSSYNQTVTATNPGPVQWPQTRPTLTGGVVGGRLGGTPAQVARPPDDPAILTADDGRARRKNTPGDQSMRRTIQDLVASVDPNVKMEPEVEDVCVSFLAFCSPGLTRLKVAPVYR